MSLSNYLFIMDNTSATIRHYDIPVHNYFFSFKIWNTLKSYQRLAKGHLAM